ncbi:P-loop containing nucleoside triphosphate hydrolase protein [Viridothelium virens]|uniref:P-loop containing nucleoside triphosphate hydrolase protein n=1 Tax=Viridothelium virens TaxID=1048519 RepID=A0A6A6H2V7_VIRVR|nr:P-loop containing nucleoside triphosphate hydrolase protein [Viridothelium virens]
MARTQQTPQKSTNTNGFGIPITQDAAQNSERNLINDEPGDNLAPTGSLPKIRNLYEARHKQRALPWTAKYPDDLEEPLENAESAQYALLVRYNKCYDMRKKLRLDSIVVQSPLLKSVLRSVLDKYPGITTSLQRLEFSAPFQPFVHRWEQLSEARKKQTHPEVCEHLDLLWNVLEEELRDVIREKQDLVANGVVTFDSIWTIFEPGALVFHQDEGHDRIYKLKSGSYQQTPCDKFYRMQCEYVDFDGESFGLGHDTVSVPSFAGTAPITKLPVYPAIRHAHYESLKERLLARGKLFEAYKGYHFKAYQGIAIGQGYFGPICYNVDSRIIIDRQAYNRFNPNQKVNIQKLNIGDSASSDNDDREAEARAFMAPKSLSEEQLLICAPSLRGYSLRDKKWLQFFVDSVKDIIWNEDAFNSLVAPQEQKDLILAFAQSQAKNNHGFDDVIQGKGRGIIMLLSGPPGVGKTLTAESVAETMKVPLYMMSAGDLGASANDVESKLGTILEMNAKWNACLLLDEADVFLEARSAHDLERNRLVSVFLRLLEYYEGILFLTTNRVDNIDAAFDSRIHLTLEYDELDLDSRRYVWRTFLSKVSNVGEFSAPEVDKLAEAILNGRQIKNVLKTAQLLAAKKEEPLNFQHVDVVLRLRSANASKRRPFKA